MTRNDHPLLEGLNRTDGPQVVLYRLRGPQPDGPRNGDQVQTMGHDEDLYLILGVEPDAEPETIDHAFRNQMKKLHPDYAQNAADVARRTTAASRLNHAADIL